ncbi:MAG: hypothetical protein J0H85_14465 [Sediminibacterium magnilacihabitans]|jgi:hypothetical protein|nr:hypothetical protein [Sediminibacterium magnilacihabitans]PQV59637.1 hypothetical protein CLV53_11520 [Sediminibacterium magnilacihabitans]
MDIFLQVNFNSITSECFTIVNPPVIPNTGDTVDFEFSEFIENKKEVRKLENYLENGLFIAERLSISYYKEHVKVILVLHEDKHFIEAYGDKFVTTRLI